MSKAKQRNKNQPQRHNASVGPRQVDIGKRPDYHGNSRFIELGTPGVPFRHLINVDHISSLRFEENYEEHEFPVDKDGEASTEKRTVLVGFNVVIAFLHNNNCISFNDPQQAMSCYNALLDQIVAVGAPMTRLPRLEATLDPKPEPSVIEGVDGDLIADAVNDTLDGEVPLTDEDLAMLEHPEIDVDRMVEATEPEEPPEKAN